MASLNPLTGVLGSRRAAHLLRRSTFGPNRATIENFATKTVSQAVTDLMNVQPVASKPLDPLTSATWVDNLYVSGTNTDENTLRAFVISWWLDNARKDTTIQHKMVAFLHQYFITAFEDVRSEVYYDYLKLLEYYALGSYKTLATKMSLNSSMLVYLDGNLSTGGSPNENFAREFLELFTIGKGPQIGPDNYTNYTENDIKEAAKVLTGYQYVLANTTVDADTGIRCGKMTRSRHRWGNKTFSSCFQGTVITSPATQPSTDAVAIPAMQSELTQFVTMVFNQDATAKSICRRLYRYFVYPKISAEIETDIITPLATQLKANNYNLGLVLQTLLNSQHFYDADDAVDTDETIGAKLKSPLDLLFGTMNFFNIQPPTPLLNNYQYFYRDIVQNFWLVNTGMGLFRPDNVAGYKPYYQEPDFDRLWLNSSTIVSRYSLGRMLLENKKIISSGSFNLTAAFDILAWVKNPANCSDPSNGTVLVDEITRYLLPENPFSIARFTFFRNDALFGGLSQTNWANEWTTHINTPPGTTAGNNAQTIVKGRLVNLFKAIIYSQEYQLH
ncbi:MAG: DUF1800 family protein [Pedobacter sp.]|nr:MAG: DUF1800 family protein [Pedobacter sp.]